MYLDTIAEMIVANFEHKFTAFCCHDTKFYCTELRTSILPFNAVLGFPK